MKIIINTIPLLSPPTGIGNYTYNLIQEFQRLRPDWDYSYYYGYFTKQLKVYSEESKGFYRAKEFIKKTPLGSSFARKMKRNLTSLQRNSYDLYFEPNFIPLDIKAKKTVTTICDFSLHHYPECHPKDRVNDWSKNFTKKIKKSDAIITISNYVENEIREILNLDDIPIFRSYLGYDASIFNLDVQGNIKINVPGNYILFVGSVEPRKNIINLLKAYRQLPANLRKDLQLLLAGFKGWENKEVVALLESMKNDVQYLGFVDNQMLAMLYKNATCFIYPSLYEGFGLPPLEAMACGSPVVVSDVASLPEVCGDAACYVNPHDVDSITNGMYKVLADSDLRKSMIKKGIERSNLFSWEKTAKEHIKIFEEVLAS